VIRVNIDQLVSCAVAHFVAFRLKNVGNLESVISRLYYKQRRTDKWEHILSQETHIRHVPVVLSACRLREGRILIIQCSLEYLHLILVIVLVIPQTLIVDVEGAICESPVSDLAILR